nr:hypothetical protein 14 [bacterium]
MINNQTLIELLAGSGSIDYELTAQRSTPANSVRKIRAGAIRALKNRVIRARDRGEIETAKALTAKLARLEDIQFGACAHNTPVPTHAKRESLTGCDVAAAFGKHNEIGYLIIRSKYLEDRHSLKALNLRLETIFDFAMHWHGLSAKIVTAKKLAAIAAILSGSFRPCLNCKAHGKVFKRGDWIDCGACRGTGAKPVRDAEIARNLGISRAGYRQTWRALLEQILIGLAEAEDRAFRHARKNLSGITT